MTTLVERLAAFAEAATFDSLPVEVRDSVRQRVLDIQGISVAALTLDTSQAAIDHAVDAGGKAEAFVTGTDRQLPVAAAAFAGGVLAHSLDYDDTHLPSVLHPSASVVPASLAAAQAAGRGGEALVAAIAAGLEICVRLGMAGYDRDKGNSMFFERGQHATSICGALACAAAAAKLYGLDAAGIGHAIGIAASMGSGVIEANRGGGTVKRLHCGIAAQAGVNAALLAKRGFTGPPSILEGRFGFFSAWLGGDFDASPIEKIGEDWEVPGIFFKPYPANHFTHAGIDAAIALRNEGLKPEHVRLITLGVPSPVVRTIGEPIDVKRAPQTGYQAQFSGPYTIAAALLGGSGLGLGLDDFTDALATAPQRQALMRTVTVEADAECDRIYPMQFPAVLTVETTDGSTLQKKVLANRGGPETPLSDTELAVKFEDNVLRVLPEKAALQIAEAALRIEKLETVADLVKPAATNTNTKGSR